MIPPWVQRMPTIWIATVQGLDPRMPTGAIALVPHHVQALLTGAPLPIEVARAWIQGADVEYADDAPSAIRTLAHQLRILLPDACRPFEAKVGADFGMPRAGATMAVTPGIPTLQQLADAVVDLHPDGVPRLSHEARLLRALTGL